MPCKKMKRGTGFQEMNRKREQFPLNGGAEEKKKGKEAGNVARRLRVRKCS